MGSFGERVGAPGTGHAQTNNNPAAHDAKVEIRERVMQAVVGDDKAAIVFDCFAGDGEMFRCIWKRAAGYVGCDLKYYPDEREAFVGDNRRIMRNIDLRPFNIFDLDAHGGPWEQAIILAARRPMKKGERIGVVLTEGSNLSLKFGNFSLGLRAIAAVNPKAAGGAAMQDDLIDRAIIGLQKRIGAKRIAHRWEARASSRGKVRYIGLVLEA